MTRYKQEHKDVPWTTKRVLMFVVLYAPLAVLVVKALAWDFIPLPGR
jgi:hypothetical protein